MSIESSSPDRSSTAETLLRDLGQSGGSGVLEIRHPGEELSYVWVRAGRIYAMQVPGYRPALGIRLLSGGLVSPEQLSTAAAEQRERRPGQLIGEVLVGMGFVDPAVIELFVSEQVRDQVADLLDLEVLDAEFHAGRHIRQGLAEPAEVDALLAVAHECRARRADVLTRIGGPGVVPVLGPPSSGPTQTPLGPYDWALLCRVDGQRDLTELARVCGFTVLEAAQVVADLAMTGLLALPEPTPTDPADLAPVVSLHPGAEPEDPQWRFDGTDAGEPDPVAVPAPDPAEAAGTADASRELLAEFGALLRDEPVVEFIPGGAQPAADEVQDVGTAAAGALAEALESEGLAPDALAAADALEVLPATGEPVTGPELGDGLVPPVVGALTVVPPPAQPGLTLLPAAERRPLSVVDNSPRPELAVVAPAGAGQGRTEDTVPSQAAAPVQGEAAPVTGEARPGSQSRPEDQTTQVDGATQEPASGPMPANADSGPDTTAFMRELSSLSDDPDRTEPVVTRLVVPLTEQRRKRRPWSR